METQASGCRRVGDFLSIKIPRKDGARVSSACCCTPMRTGVQILAPVQHAGHPTHACNPSSKCRVGRSTETGGCQDLIASRPTEKTWGLGRDPASKKYEKNGRGARQTPSSALSTQAQSPHTHAHTLAEMYTNRYIFKKKSVLGWEWGLVSRQEENISCYSKQGGLVKGQGGNSTDPALSHVFCLSRCHGSQWEGWLLC